MADANTTKYGFVLPEVGASSDSWGGKLSQNHTDTDALLGAYALAGGTTAYTLTTGLSLAAYVDGQSFLVRVNATCTGASTLNADSLGAKNLRKVIAGTLTALASGDIQAGEYIRVTYNSASDVFVIHGVLYNTLTTGYQPLDATLTALAALMIASGKLIKGTGTDTFTTIDVTSGAESFIAGTTLASLTMLYTDAGAGIGPYFLLDRNSASPAANDELGGLLFRGRDSGGNTFEYSRIYGKIADPTDASEDGGFTIETNHAAPIGPLTFSWGLGAYYSGLTDQGAGTLNYVALYENNTSLSLKYVALTGGNLISGDQIVGGTTAKPLTLSYTNNGGSLGPYISLNRASTSPAAADDIGGIEIVGDDSAGNDTAYAYMFGRIVSATNTTESGSLVWQTILSGSQGERMILAGGLYHPSATGTDKGNNTINFGAVYDDNTLLTCFVLEYARTGSLDLDFWDALAPSGKHEAAHRFWRDRALLDIEAYIGFWKENGHLPGLPSRDEWRDHGRDKKPVGDMVSRLWQTVEMQAVHIAEMHTRLKAAGL